MKRSMMVTLVLVAFLCLTSIGDWGLVRQAVAGDYSNGYVNAAGYTWNDGYWWRGNSAYSLSRAKEYYWSNGCQYYRWVTRYTPVAVRKVVITKQDLSEDGWRGKLLDIAKQRDWYEGKARQSTVEHNEFVESVRVLGLENNFHWNGYGYEMQYAQGGVQNGYGAYGSSYSQQPAQQGSTIYGYSELADIYGNVDLGALYNSVLRLRSQSYQNESAATSETHALVGELGGQMARIKEIEAKGYAAAAALEAANAKDRATLLREFWQSYPQEKAAAVMEQQGTSNTEVYRSLQTLVQNKCVACHNPNKQSGGLDMTALAQLSSEQGESVLQRIIHPDPARRMPLAADGGPGHALSAAEVALFFLGAYGGGDQAAAQN